MTDFPKGMRLAAPGDEKRILDIFITAHAENGWGDLDLGIVQATILKATGREGVVMALIDGAERIEAVMALHSRKADWYNSDDNPKNYCWHDLLIYVHPLHRRSRHSLKLFRFAQWWEQQIKMPVVLGLLPRGEYTKKKRLFAYFGREIGSAYLIGSAGPLEEHDARH